MTGRQMMLAVLLFSCKHGRQHQTDNIQEIGPDDAAARLLAKLDELSPADRFSLYGCEPENWTQDWRDPKRLIDVLLKNGRIEVESLTSLQIQTAFQSCNSFRSPLGCCQSEYYYTWDWIARSGEASAGAWTGLNGYGMACRFAPGGYKSVRGCISYVALAPFAADYEDELNPGLTGPAPITDEVRLEILRRTLESVSRGWIDE